MDLVSFSREILNGKLHFLCSDKAGYCISFVWSCVLGETDNFDSQSVLAMSFIKRNES